MKVLITGGSGYLGQFIVKALSASHAVALTYNVKKLNGQEIKLLGSPGAFQVDLKNGAGLDRVLEEFGPPDVVVNCAAISVPRECEKDPEAAQAINVPGALLSWLEGLALETPPLLIHLSTDQVYDGTRAFWTEADKAEPVNKYGATKVDAEKLIRDRWRNYAILRSSIIVGPAPPLPLPKGLPLQWIDSTLSAQKETEFFHDEFRCPVFVLDIVKVVERLVSNFSQGRVIQELFNTGGPDRLSRAAMAETVARVRGYAAALIKTVPAASVNRGVASPPDISMDISHLTTTLGVRMTNFEEAVRLTFS